MVPRGLSTPLHNFSMPQWGYQRRFVCGKVNPTSKSTHSFDSNTDSQCESLNKYSELEKLRCEISGKSTMVVAGEASKIEDDAVNKIRDKLLCYIFNDVNNMKVLIRKEGEEEEEEEEEDLSTVFRPFNLRKRRAGFPALIDAEIPVKRPRNKDGRKTSPSTSASSPPQKVIRVENPIPISLRSRGLVAYSEGADKEKKPMISLRVPLSRKEIDDDLFAIFGEKPPKRPKKRTTVERKELDAIFPGLCLSKITADKYKVPDEAKPKKK